MEERIKPGQDVACICEGSSEVLVINMLLDRGALLFDRSQLLMEEPLGPRFFRSQDLFIDQFLGMDFGEEGLALLVIQDRKNASYTIRRPYSEKVAYSCYVVTAPEIEMLMVHSCGLYTKYKKQKDKPSVFMAQHLKISGSKLKSREFIEKFYSDHDLVEAIREHKRKSVLDGKQMIFLADLLKK